MGWMVEEIRNPNSPPEATPYSPDNGHQGVNEPIGPPEAVHSYCGLWGYTGILDGRFFQALDGIPAVIPVELPFNNGMSINSLIEH